MAYYEVRIEMTNHYTKYVESNEDEKDIVNKVLFDMIDVQGVYHNHELVKVSKKEYEVNNEKDLHFGSDDRVPRL